MAYIYIEREGVKPREGEKRGEGEGKEAGEKERVEAKKLRVEA